MMALLFIAHLKVKIVIRIIIPQALAPPTPSPEKLTSGSDTGSYITIILVRTTLKPRAHYELYIMYTLQYTSSFELVVDKERCRFSHHTSCSGFISVNIDDNRHSQNE